MNVTIDIDKLVQSPWQKSKESVSDVGPGSVLSNWMSTLGRPFRFLMTSKVVRASSFLGC